MESHVSGGITPLSLGELRQAILAVVVSSARFKPEEQLHINHFVHECECCEELAQLLRGLRMEEAKRSFLHRNEVAQALDYPGVCFGKDAHLLEMEALLHCRALDRYQKEPVWWVANPGWGAADRLKTLGFCYQMLLENLGGYLPARRGYNALGDN